MSPAVANRQTGWLNADLFGTGTQACYTPPQKGRRKAGDLPDDLACARLISHGIMILSGKSAVEEFEKIQSRRVAL